MDFASKQIFDVKLWENGVSPSQLFKDEEYIKLGEQAIKNLRQAYGQGLVSGKDAGRVTSLINTQMDYGFADTMAKNLNNPPNPRLKDFNCLFNLCIPLYKSG